MLNTQNEKRNTVFYSYLASFVNTFSLNMYVSMSYTRFTKRNPVFIILWLRRRDTCISITRRVESDIRTGPSRRGVGGKRWGGGVTSFF